MKRFRILRVDCERCGEAQMPDRWAGECGSCGCERFRVEIERAASGWESFDLEDVVPKPLFTALLDGGSSEPYWRTHSFLTCAGVSAEEIGAFCESPVDARRSMYVSWKRRELEAAITHRRRVCGRCRVIFKAYRNEWNRDGFCSRSCRIAAVKSKQSRR